MWRGNMSFNNSEHYLSIYGINNANYGTVESFNEVGTSDRNGSLYINKSGDIITSGFVDQTGNTYSWQYHISDFSISSDSFWIGIDASNGPYDSTSVLFSSFNVETAPVPEPATMLLFGTGLAGLVGSKLRPKKK